MSEGGGEEDQGPSSDMTGYQSEHLEPPFATVDVGNNTALRHYGCFQDSQNREPFSGGFASRESQLPFPSVLECARQAAMNGKSVFGMETGNECRWADSVTQGTKLGSSTACDAHDGRGAPSGGKYAFNLYSIPPEQLEKINDTAQNKRIRVNRDADLYWRGCYHTDGNETINRLKVPNAGGQSFKLVENCATVAALRNKHWFATTAHEECFVGDDPKVFMQSKDSSSPLLLVAMLFRMRSLLSVGR